MDPSLGLLKRYDSEQEQLAKKLFPYQSFVIVQSEVESMLNKLVIYLKVVPSFKLYIDYRSHSFS